MSLSHSPIQKSKSHPSATQTHHRLTLGRENGAIWNLRSPLTSSKEEWETVKIQTILMVRFPITVLVGVGDLVFLPWSDLVAWTTWNVKATNWEPPGNVKSILFKGKKLWNQLVCTQCSKRRKKVHPTRIQHGDSRAAREGHQLRLCESLYQRKCRNSNYTWSLEQECK